MMRTLPILAPWLMLPLTLLNTLPTLIALPIPITPRTPLLTGTGLIVFRCTLARRALVLAGGLVWGLALFPLISGSPTTRPAAPTPSLVSRALLRLTRGAGLPLLSAILITHWNESYLPQQPAGNLTWPYHTSAGASIRGFKPT